MRCGAAIARKQACTFFDSTPYYSRAPFIKGHCHEASYKDLGERILPGIRAKSLKILVLLWILIFANFIFIIYY
jgi:hypothetical protein